MLIVTLTIAAVGIALLLAVTRIYIYNICLNGAPVQHGKMSGYGYSHIKNLHDVVKYGVCVTVCESMNYTITPPPHTHTIY
jgi:hypothetical protein